jgi:hypothetical protein
LQRAARAKLLSPQRLHRKNLAERLFFEESMVMGTIRLINQVMVFTLLLLALNRSSDQATKRGIWQDLESTFDFGEIESISSKADFRDTMLSIADNSKVSPRLKNASNH